MTVCRLVLFHGIMLLNAIVVPPTHLDKQSHYSSRWKGAEFFLLTNYLKIQFKFCSWRIFKFACCLARFCLPIANLVPITWHSKHGSSFVLVETPMDVWQMVLRGSTVKPARRLLIVAEVLRAQSSFQFCHLDEVKNKSRHFLNCHVAVASLNHLQLLQNFFTAAVLARNGRVNTGVTTDTN